MIKPVDESKLNTIDRLGLAYCRLCGWQWDELLGQKPPGFDALPNFDRRKHRAFRKPMQTKYEIITPKIRAIKTLIGQANASRCWWIFKLGRTEEEWRAWYSTGEYERLYKCCEGYRER